MIQKTEISISGGGLPWEFVIAILILVAVIIALVVWLFRSVRKTIYETEEHPDQYSLIGTEQRERVEEAEPVVELPEPITDQLSSMSPSASDRASAEQEIAPPGPPDVRPQPKEPGPPPSPISVGEEPTAVSPPPQPVADVGTAGTLESGPPRARPVEPEWSQPGGAPTEPVPSDAASTPSTPASATPVLRTFEYEVEQEQHQRARQWAIAGSIVLILAIYALVPPVHRVVNSIIASGGQRIGGWLERAPTVSAELEPLPQLELVEEVNQRDHRVTIKGRVRNISSHIFDGLFVEFVLVRRDVGLPETRLVSVEPATLPPNREGTYRLQISADEFSEYQVRRIVTADKKDVTFRLSLALPPGSTTH